MDKVKCQNCDWEGDESQVLEIEDVLSRVYPGETMPAGECPKCGCLAHYIKEEDHESILLLARRTAIHQELETISKKINGLSKTQTIVDFMFMFCIGLMIGFFAAQALYGH